MAAELDIKMSSSGVAYGAYDTDICGSATAGGLRVSSETETARRILRT